MHKLTRLWIASWSRALSFRGDVFLWWISETMEPIVLLAIWVTVSLNSTGGLTPQETLTYYIFVMITVSATNVWNGFFLAGDILKGTIIQFLTRPIGIFWYYFLRNVSAKAIRALPIVIVYPTAIFALHDRLSPTIFEPRNIGFYVLSLFGGLIIAFTLDMCFACLAFWIDDAIQIREYKDVIFMISSGLLIPFAFMPPLAQTIFNWLPFRYVIATPVEIMLGQAPGTEAIKLIGIQIIWIVIFSVILKILWKQGLKAYAIPGQ